MYGVLLRIGAAWRLKSAMILCHTSEYVSVPEISASRASRASRASQYPRVCTIKVNLSSTFESVYLDEPHGEVRRHLYPRESAREGGGEGAGGEGGRLVR